MEEKEVKKLKIKELFKINGLEDVLTLVFVFIFAIQFIVIFYINLTQTKYHLGYDASKNYLCSIHMAQTGKLFMDDWSPTTGYPFYGIINMAAFFYSITGDIFLSYGITMEIMVVVLAVLLYVLLKSMSLSGISVWIPMNLLLVPYIGTGYNNANDLGYFSCMITGASYYSIIVATDLLFFYVIVSDKTKWSKWKKIVILSLSTLFTALAGIITFMLAVVPVFLYYIVAFIFSKNIKYIKSFNFIFIIINAVALLVVQKLEQMTGYAPKTSGFFPMVSLDKLSDEFSNVVAGFAILIRALPEDGKMPAMSLEAVPYLCSVFIFFIFAAAAIYYIIKINKQADSNESLFVFLIIVNFAIFFFIPMQYGMDYMESRYWLTGYAVFLILLGCLLKTDMLGYLKNAIVIGFIAVFLILDITGDKTYITTRIDSAQMEKIRDVMTAYDVPVVYTRANEEDMDNVRIYDEKRYYCLISEEMDAMSYWGNVIAFREAGEYQGPTGLVVDKGKFEDLPEYIRNYYIPVDSTENYDLYYSYYNVFDFNTDMKSDLGIDFPYTKGYTCVNGQFDASGAWVTDGTPCYTIYGPGQGTIAGTYDITLYYSDMIEGKTPCFFDFALDGGKDIIASVELDPQKNSVTLEGVTIDYNHSFEQRVYNGDGAYIRIQRIERKRIK